MKCFLAGCERPLYARGMCQKHYEREHYHERHPNGRWNVLRSDNLRRVDLDDIALNWLLGVFERLPGRGKAAGE